MKRTEALSNLLREKEITLFVIEKSEGLSVLAIEKLLEDVLRDIKRICLPSNVSKGEIISLFDEETQELKRLDHPFLTD